MEIIKTVSPAKALALDLAQYIHTQSGTTLCLCAGGSALEIFSYLNDEDVKRRTIFMMGDERASGEPSVNNYLQLKARLADSKGFQIIDTGFYEADENQYAEKLTKLVMEEMKNAQSVVAILGIGPDGHTAGIFPLSKDCFEEVYTPDGTYVPVHLEGLTIDSRASLTPNFILKNVSKLFGYAAGSSKKEILERLIKEPAKLNERPAELLKLHHNATLYTDAL